MRNKGSDYPHLNDDGKLVKRYHNKKNHARKEGIGFKLSFIEFCHLLSLARITSSDIGNNGHHLARYQDSGPYALGNCRFVPHVVNRNEQDYRRISFALLDYYRTHENAFKGRRHSSDTKRRIGLANSRAQAGARNSQFGTKWVTNGHKNQKIPKDAPLPIGYRLGRVC